MQVTSVRPLGEVLQDMHDSPEFCEGRVAGCPEGYVAYQDADRINSVTNDALKNSDTGVYQFGMDWAEPFKHYTWSTGFMFARYNINSNEWHIRGTCVTIIVKTRQLRHHLEYMYVVACCGLSRHVTKWFGATFE